MASTVADNVSRRRAPLSANLGRKLRCLRARAPMIASAYTYKLYIPGSHRPEDRVPLVIMLHGCTQSPDDFAAGTRMNEVAEIHACIVAYPGQTAAANTQRCWNWFNEKDQHRDWVSLR